MSLWAPSTGGSWWIKSESDSRWNHSGSSNSCGGLTMPPECKKIIDKFTELLGEAPNDLEFGYTKY